jgi:hypothetical protein
MVTMRCLHNDPTTHDAVIKAFELRYLLTNVVLNCLGRGHVAKCDLQGNFHLLFSSRVVIFSFSRFEKAARDVPAVKEL